MIPAVRAAREKSEGGSEIAYAFTVHYRSMIRLKQEGHA